MFRTFDSIKNPFRNLFSRADFFCYQNSIFLALPNQFRNQKLLL